MEQALVAFNEQSVEQMRRRLGNLSEFNHALMYSTVNSIKIDNI